MRQLRLDATIYDVPITVVGCVHRLSRTHPPEPGDVELVDIMIGEVSVNPLINDEEEEILSDYLYSYAVDDWQAAAEDFEDARREERMLG